MVYMDPLLFFQFIREATGGLFNSFFLACSVYGETTAVIILTALLYWCIDKKIGEYVLVSMGWANLINGIVKLTACIYRPWVVDSRIKPVEDALATANGYSFPSGHVTSLTTLFGGPTLKANISKAFKILLWIFVLIIGLSRLYLGVHFVSDVVFAFLFTLAVLLIVKKLFDMVEENPNLDLIISAAGIIVSILFVVYAMTKSYPMDYDAAGKLIANPAKLMLESIYKAGFACAIFISWPIERRYIKFSSDGDVQTRLFRGLLGFIILEVYFNCIGMPIYKSGTVIGIFLSTFIPLIFIMLIYPICINYFNKRNSESSEESVS